MEDFVATSRDDERPWIDGTSVVIAKVDSMESIWTCKGWMME
jgi:hypothetical protein